MNPAIRRIIAFLVINFSSGDDIKSIYDDDFEYYEFQKLPVMLTQIHSLSDKITIIFSESREQRIGYFITNFHSFLFKPEIKIVLDKSSNSFYGSVDLETFTGTIYESHICIYEDEQEYDFGV